MLASSSSRTGHLPELFQEESGDTDFKWQAEYGSIVRVKAPFGVSAMHAATHAPAARRARAPRSRACGLRIEKKEKRS